MPQRREDKLVMLARAIINLTDEQRAILGSHIASEEMTMAELIESLRSTRLPAAHVIARDLEHCIGKGCEDD